MKNKRRKTTTKTSQLAHSNDTLHKGWIFIMISMLTQWETDKTLSILNIYKFKKVAIGIDKKYWGYSVVLVQCWG